eukprot:1177569-Prorocentrum_minimum.AAC.6
MACVCSARSFQWQCGKQAKTLLCGVVSTMFLAPALPGIVAAARALTPSRWSSWAPYGAFRH